MSRLWCDGPTLMRAVAAAVVNLERHVDEVDALNVFPVPDGDTGSNMLATMRAALAEAERLPVDGRDLHSVALALSRGALTGARGNSGVILSQIIRGMTHVADGRRRASGVELAAGLRQGSEVAYRSVLTPVEGTILTVIRDTAEAAEAAAGRQPHVEEVLAAAIEAAASSVARTPSLLPVLQDAGVVDSGGQGLYRLLEGTFQLGADLGALVPTAPGTLRRAGNGADPTPTMPGRPGGRVAGAETPALGDDAAFGYETTYLLEAVGTPLDLESLRRELEAVGESVVVAGDEAAARIHVHGARPDLALGVGVRAGRVGDVGVEDLDSQVEHRAAWAAQAAPAEPGAALDGLPAEVRVAGSPATGVAVVAVALTDAQARAFRSLGVPGIVRPPPGEQASTGEIAAAVLRTGARDVIVLPDETDTHLAAQLAGTLVAPASVSVLETRNIAEGIAAALSFDPAATLAQNLERMSGEARRLRTFRLATAVRDAIVDARAVRDGQVLAIDPESRLLAQADDLGAACLAALAELALDGPELITIYQGEAVPDPSVADLAGRLGDAVPGVTVEVVAGGQRGDGILVAVE